MDYSSFATFICTAIIIIVFLILILWTWFFKLKRDYKRYIQNYSQILSSSNENPPPGADGDNGLDAYDVYRRDNVRDNPALTSEEFEAKYQGLDAYNIYLEDDTKNNNTPLTLEGFQTRYQGSDGYDNYINYNIKDNNYPLTLEEFQTRYQESGGYINYLIDNNYRLTPDQFQTRYQGQNGYDNYLQDNIKDNPPLTIEKFEAKYRGVDGIHGSDAQPAINGEHGDDGSIGDIGVHGQHGEDGENGIKGETGLEGDSFVTFDESSTILPPGTIPIGNKAPENYPSCAFVSYHQTDPEAYIKYFFKGNLLFTLTTSWTKDLDKSSGFISYIIYDEKKNIIGFTEPLTLFNFNPEFQVTTTIEQDNDLILYYRGILSLNKALTMSSFTYNIMESNLSDKDFLFRRAQEVDPFIDKFYNIIQDVPDLKKDDVEFFDMSKISTMLEKLHFPMILTLG